MFRHLITEKKSTSYPSFIYSCSVGQILQHEIFCLGRLGSSGSKEKKVDFEQLLRVGFSTFLGQNKIQNFFKNILETASKSDIKWLLQFYFYFLKKLKKVEIIGYHSNLNFECNTESGSKESLSIALGILFYSKNKSKALIQCIWLVYISQFT